HGVEWRHPRLARQIRVGAVLEQIGGDVEMAVDGGDEEWRVWVGRSDWVDARAAVDERPHGMDGSLTRREMERGQSALPANQLVEGERPRHARAGRAPTAGAG